MNFGNKNRVKPTEFIQNKNAEQINNDRQYNSAYNENKPIKRKGWFNKNKQEKQEQLTSTTSETIWREVNLFWPETIAITGTLIASLILIFVLRFISANSLEMIKETLSEQAYNEVAGLLMNMNSLFLLVGAVPLLVLIGFYVYRLVVFTPRGNKHMVARFERTGAVRISVDKIKDDKLKFFKGIMGEEMKITNPRKHWLSNLGKPFIVLFEGDDSNADLNLMAGKVSDKSKDTNSINDSMFNFGIRWERKMREKTNGLLTPMNILLILVLGAVGLTLFLVLKNPETTAQLMQGPVAMIRVM